MSDKEQIFNNSKVKEIASGTAEFGGNVGMKGYDKVIANEVAEKMAKNGIQRD